MKSEYKRCRCLYCKSRKLRAKLKGDWTIEDRMRSGEHAYANYWICDECGRTSMSTKGTIVTSIATIGAQYMLWWFIK